MMAWIPVIPPDAVLSAVDIIDSIRKIKSIRFFLNVSSFTDPDDRSVKSTKVRFLCHISFLDAAGIRLMRLVQYHNRSSMGAPDFGLSKP